MEINENCSDWEIKYSHELDADLDDLSLKVCSELLHTSGDVISVLARLIGKNPETLVQVLPTVYESLIKFREDVQYGINLAIAKYGMSKELSGEFSYDNLFGTNIVASLRDNLKTESEQDLANEYLETDDDENTEDN